MTDTIAMCRELGTDTAACAALANWDGRFNVDSRGALLFSRYWSKIGRLPSAQLWQMPSTSPTPVHMPNTLNTANPLVRQALLDAVADLRTADIPFDAPLQSSDPLSTHHTDQTALFSPRPVGHRAVL